MVLDCFSPSVVFLQTVSWFGLLYSATEILLKFRVQKSEIRLRYGDPLCGLQTADSSLCPHVGREQGEESGCLVTLRKVPAPFVGAPPA